MLNRNNNGKLVLKTLDFQIMIGDMFVQCDDEGEVDFLQENLTGIIENLAEERKDEIDMED